MERQEGGEGIAGEAIAAFAAVGEMAERSFSMEMASVWRSRTVYSLLISLGMRTSRPESGKGVAIGYAERQAQGYAQSTHFIFEQIARRFVCVDRAPNSFSSF